MSDPNAAWIARVRATWDGRAERWHATAERDAAAPDRTAELVRTVAALGLRPGDRVLDAGCGSGQWARALAARGMRVTAVDVSPEMIALARTHAVDGPPIDWRVGDLARLDDPDATYDAVHCRVALQFAPDVPAALRELRRVLRPGGRLLASVPGSLSPIYRASWERHRSTEPPVVNWIVPWELERLLEADGWTVLDGWGEHGVEFIGEPNTIDPERLAGLDRRLRQAAATTWCVVAG